MSKDMLYKCIRCGHEDIVFADDPKKDGRRCSECFQYSTPIGYADNELSKREVITIDTKILEKWISGLQ